MDGTSDLLTRHKLTVGDYYRMADIGVLGADDRVELIGGEVIDMAPIGVAHASVVGRITQAFGVSCVGRALVWVQNPIRLDDLNEPQPDFAILKPRADFYETKHPGPADILLLVEVADSSARYDRAVKLPLYARAGIAEVWIVDLQQRVVEAYRLPMGDGFAQESLHRPGEILSVVGAPDIQLRVDQVFG